VYSLDGLVLGVGYRQYKPSQAGPGVAEYNPKTITNAVEESLSDAVTTAGVNPLRVKAITTDAMVSGTIGIDHDGQPTTAYTTTLDTRFSPDLDLMISSHGAKVRELVGSGSPVIAAKIAWYRRTKPEQFARTSVFLGAGGFVGGHLAGLGAAEAFIDSTVLWAVGLSDTRSRKWSPLLLEALEIPIGLLPRIVDSTSVVGTLTSDVALRTGLTPGIPVIAGCGDQMAGFLGANVIGEETIGDSAGTYEVVGLGVEEFPADPMGLFDIVPSAIGKGYVQQSVVAIGGGFTREWFESKIAAKGRNDQNLDLDRLAESVGVGSDGLLFVPHLGGQSSPSRPLMRGAWLGLEWHHHQGHLRRSILEAMAFEVGDAVDAMVSSGDRSKRLVGYGGGAQSALACQIKADVTGLTYSSLGDIAPASLASALIGAVAVGALDDISPVIRNKTRIVNSFNPNPSKTREYRRYRSDYNQAVELVAKFRSPSLHADQ
jgi:xylulokinase